MTAFRRCCLVDGAAQPVDDGILSSALALALSRISSLLSLGVMCAYHYKTVCSFMLKLTAYIMKQYCILYERDGMRWLDYVLRCDCHAIPVCESKWRWRYLKRKLKTYKRKFSNVRLLFFFKKRVNGCAPQPADSLTSAGHHSAGTMKPSARQAAPLPALQPTERIIASASSSSGASQLTEQALAPRLDLAEVRVRMSWR